MNATEPTKPIVERAPETRHLTARIALVTFYVVGTMALTYWWGVAVLILAVFAAPVLLCPRGRSRELALLNTLTAYLSVCIVTIPFADSLWLGEIPLLALPQLPKVEFAGWLRRVMIADVIRPLGLSKGSYSPDLIATRPYALALAYLIPLGLMLILVWYRTRLIRPISCWAIILVIVALLDFAMTLVFAGGPGFTIY